MGDKKIERGDNGYWSGLNGLVQSAVVQVFVQVAPFNWIQPYRIESPFEGRGTGFFVSDEGHFITNAHVVYDARRVWIHIPSLGRVPLAASVVGICPEIDTALLRLHAEAYELVIAQLGRIAYFELGDSDDIKPTQNVLALGYPLGQNHVKSTAGVISGREFLGGRAYIQMTAPVNPGNSGGPMVGADGKVLGITVAGVLDAQNVGYAIPINEVKNSVDALLLGGLVTRPKLGMVLGFANDEKAAFLNNPYPGGVYVSAVMPGSLCDLAGVHEGDMIYELNGYAIDQYGETGTSGSAGRICLYDVIAKIKTGQQVSMVVYRHGSRIDITFIYEVQQSLPIRRLYAGYEPIDYEVIGGLVLMPLTDNHMELFYDSMPMLLSYQLPKNRLEGAVLITYLFPGSYVDHTNTLMAGDIVRYVNGMRITDLSTLRTALHHSIDTGLVVIKTEYGSLVVLSLEKIVQDEERLSMDFIYPISQTIVHLRQALSEVPRHEA